MEEKSTSDVLGQVLPFSEWRKLVLKMPVLFPFTSVSYKVNMGRVLERVAGEESAYEPSPCLPAVLQAVGKTLQDVPWSSVYCDTDAEGNSYVAQAESAIVGQIIYLDDCVAQIPLPDAASQAQADIAALLREEVARRRRAGCAYLAEVNRVIAQTGGFGPRAAVLPALPRLGQDLFTPVVSVADLSAERCRLAVSSLWPYQLAKITVGSVQTEPFPGENGEIAPHPTTVLTLSYDHRVLKRAGAAHLLARVKAYLEESPPAPVLSKGTAVRKVVGNFSEQPHTQLGFLLDMTQAMALERELRPIAARAGEPRLAYWAILLKAVATAVLVYPKIVCRRDAEGIAYLKNLTLGFCVDTPQGLCIWAVDDPNTKTVEEIIQALADERTRWLQGQEQAVPEHATLLVSDMGPLDLDLFTCCSLHHTAIHIAFGRVRESVVLVDGQPVIRPQAMMHATENRALADPRPVMPEKDPRLSGDASLATNDFFTAIVEVLTQAQEKREIFWERRPLSTEPHLVPFSELSGWRQLWLEWLPRVPQESIYGLIDMSEVVELRRQAREVVERQAGVRLTYTAILVQAVGRALADHRILNAGYEAVGEGQIRLFPRIVVGFNVNVGEKGQPPVPIFDTEQRTLVEMAQAVDKGARRVRSMSLEYYQYLAAILRSSKQIQPDLSSFADLDMTVQVDLWEKLLADPEAQELSKNTVNTTNFGMFGQYLDLMGYVDSSNCLTLAFYQIADRPVYENGRLTQRPYMWVGTFYDLRVVDADRAARFLARLCDVLENALTTLPVQ